MIRKNSTRRKGAALVEMAIALPVLFLLFFGLIVGGMGIARYQEVARLAREATRYASVHGTEYATSVTGAKAATAQDIYDQAIKPHIATLDPSRLTYSVSWANTNSPSTLGNNYEMPSGNTVTVTVSYQWLPAWFLVGPITLSSSSTVPMLY